jgi:hypothetical protein
LLFFGTVFADNGVDEGVVDVTHNRDGGIDLGKLLDDNESRCKRGPCTSMIWTNFDAHELGMGLETLSMIAGKRTYTLLKETFDDRGVHLFALVHLSDLGTDDIDGEASNWRMCSEGNTGGGKHTYQTL